ncbi:MAG TPA: hypothetical protein VGD77_01905 [Gemmatimonadaceae bacterium]
MSKMVRWAGLASAMALVAACSDAPTAAPAAVAAGGEMAFAKGGNGKNTVDSRVFTIVPGQPLTVALGNYTLYMSSNALCAQNQGYGREFWNQPCTLEKTPVNITATWSAEDGEGNISFNRDVRFSPSARVYLLLKATGKFRNTDAILWREGEGSKAVWVDEGTYDRDMRTYSANGGTLLWRRMKHFSGYNVGHGECDSLLDPSCGNGDAPPPLF